MNTLCDVVAATVAGGALDMFVQVAVPEPGKFVVLGRLKLQGADAAAPALVNLFQQIPEEAQEGSHASKRTSIRIREWRSRGSARRTRKM